MAAQAGPCLRRPLAAAQGRHDRGLGGPRADVVSLDRLRRRRRPAAEEVGRDAVRFMMLYRKNDAVLDFDLAKVIEHSRDNPVFYVQYGHARGYSVFRNAREVFPDLPETDAARRDFLGAAAMEQLSDPTELGL